MDPPVFFERLRLPGGVWRLLAAFFALLEFVFYEFGFVMTCSLLFSHASHLKECGEHGGLCVYVMPIGAQIFDAVLFFIVLGSDVLVFVSIGNEDNYLLRSAIYIHYAMVLINIMRIGARVIMALWLKLIAVVFELLIQWICIVVFSCYYWELLRTR
ncbi:unnamed protein product [Nezara viridula]|uniref:Uncharacterized protein n=1 Tax=Nezara viridula TaxID=85310 RepID=A0A9P0HQS6_NEZVI|nr:unnamed protein product [Nezara viridula]